VGTLHTSEWLADAKKVPVGQKRRVYHGAELTAAMDVWNNEDSWSCYCHRCHVGGKVYKQYLQRVDESAPVFRKYLNKRDLVTLDTLHQTDNWKYKRVIKLLHDKGMSTVTVHDLKPMYNTVDDRLVFQFEGVDIGRDCTGRSGAKWLKYHCDDPLGYVYLQGQNSYQTREPVILTEDLFSAIKVNHYTGKACMCLLGTNFTDDKLNFIIDNKSIPVLALDGDEAGHNGEFKIKRRLDLFGIPYKCANIPNGFDPKDLNPKQLEDLFNA